MNKSDFYFELPEELIAQHPLEDRASSRLLVLDKKTGAIEHKVFKDVIDYFEAGDCLVLNNSRVLPARIFGVKDTGATVEFLLLKRLEGDCWETLVKPGRKAKLGAKFSFGEGLLTGEIIGMAEEGARVIEFKYDGIFEEILDELGAMPLPPYITAQLEDKERYQTVYSKVTGSAAAPTAGLHFTKELIEAFEAKGVHVCYVTLHVGLGTFRPVKVDNILEHAMHAEYYEISQETADTINGAKAAGKKIISVGTTSTRTIESACDEKGKLAEKSGWTDIFIYPGYEFKVIDRLITNFHLPESTLIMLVSTLAGHKEVMHAYEVAVQERYRFFSFGDAMFIK